MNNSQLREFNEMRIACFPFTETGNNAGGQEVVLSYHSEMF